MFKTTWPEIHSHQGKYAGGRFGLRFFAIQDLPKELGVGKSILHKGDT